MSPFQENRERICRSARARRGSGLERGAVRGTDDSAIPLQRTSIGIFAAGVPGLSPEIAVDEIVQDASEPRFMWTSRAVFFG